MTSFENRKMLSPFWLNGELVASVATGEVAAEKYIGIAFAQVDEGHKCVYPLTIKLDAWLKLVEHIAREIAK